MNNERKQPTTSERMGLDQENKSNLHTKKLNFAYRKFAVFFAISVFVQICTLLALTVPGLMTVKYGQEVVFETVPVDPWDMFRGDYITLRYDFNNIEIKNSFKNNQTIYAVLIQDEKQKWLVRRVAETLPRKEPGEIVLKGRTRYCSTKGVNVDYGLERVYVEEGKGKDLPRQARLKVALVVDDSGHGVIKRVFKGDKTYFLWKLI